MSDVSGIPYMGPMGQGNFFAPQFSYNPQMSAGQIQSAYMPEFYNNQNVVNNLYGGGANAGFGRLTDYYSQLAANQLSGIGSTNPYGVFGPGGGGGGGISYQGGDVGGSGATINNDAWRTSSQGPDFLGGGGLFSGGLGGFSFPQQQSGPSIDWGGVGRAAADFGGGMGPGMLSGLGGLGGAGYTPQPNSSLDWSTLFSGGGGGGGARADPYPGMSMPGGLNAPMTAQQPAYDYGSLFKDSSAQADPYPGMAMPGGLGSPMSTQQPAYDYGSLFGQGVGGAGAPQSSVFDTGTTPITGTQDTGPYGGGAGIGGLDTGRAIGAPYTAAAEPQRGMLGPPITEAYNPYFNVTGGEGAGPRAAAGTAAALTAGGGLTAADLSEQARARLAELMTGAPKEPSPADVFAGDKPVPTEGQPGLPDELAGEAGRGGMVDRAAATDPYAALPEAIPLPRERPAEADIPRPSATVPFTVEPGKEAGVRAVAPRLSAAVQGGATFLPPGYTVEAYSGLRTSGSQGHHRTGNAMDVRIIGPDGPLPSEGEDRTGMYTLLARGVKTWTQQNDPELFSQLRYGGAFGTKIGGGGVPDLMHYDLGLNASRSNYGNMRPDVGMGVLQPLTEAERNAMPANIPLLGDNQVALDVPNARSSGAATRAALPLPAEGPVTQSYPGAAAPRPPADIPDPRVSGAGFNALDAAAPPSGVEKAQSFLNRSVESILQQHSPENLSAAGFVLDLKQPMREALKGPLGGQILSGLQPRLGDVGLTRSDFAKAMADPKARFGGEFGGMGGELPSAGSFTPFEGFRPSADFGNRTGEQLGRDQLAQLQTQGISYELPEVASAPIGRELGLGDLSAPQDAGVVGPRGSAFGFEPGGFGEGGYGNAFVPNAPQVAGDTNLPAGDLTQRLLGDPFNPGNYNTLDQAYDLAAARSPYVAQATRDPALMDTLKALAVSEIGRGRSNEQYAAFFESVLNQSAARNKDDLMAFLNSGYYQPVNKGTIAQSYPYLRDNPEMSANIGSAFGQAGAGSNVSNLAMENSSNSPKYPELGAGAMLPQYGGFLNMFLPGSSEYLTSKLNPFNDPAATRFIGPGAHGAQQQYRDFWQRMMPSGTEPWLGGR